MTMIERVAHQMENRRRELIGQPLARIWNELAKAAIEAMRVPSEAMVSSQGKSRPDLAPTERARASAERLNTSVRLQAVRTYSEMIDAALLPMGVKAQLEWSHSDHPIIQKAETIVGTYKIDADISRQSSAIYALSIPGEPFGPYNLLESEAKAAAQANYDLRIRYARFLMSLQEGKETVG